MTNKIPVVVFVHDGGFHARAYHPRRYNGDVTSAEKHAIEHARAHTATVELPAYARYCPENLLDSVSAVSDFANTVLQDVEDKRNDGDA